MPKVVKKKNVKRRNVFSKIVMKPTIINHIGSNYRALPDKAKQYNPVSYLPPQQYIQKEREKPFSIADIRMEIDKAFEMNRGQSPPYPVVGGAYDRPLRENTGPLRGPIVPTPIFTEIPHRNEAVYEDEMDNEDDTPVQPGTVSRARQTLFNFMNEAVEPELPVAFQHQPERTLPNIAQAPDRVAPVTLPLQSQEVGASPYNPDIGGAYEDDNLDNIFEASLPEADIPLPPVHSPLLEIVIDGEKRPSLSPISYPFQIGSAETNPTIGEGIRFSAPGPLSPSMRIFGEPLHPMPTTLEMSDASEEVEVNEAKRGRGRPIGSRNKPKTSVSFLDEDPAGVSVGGRLRSKSSLEKTKTDSS